MLFTEFYAILRSSYPQATIFVKQQRPKVLEITLTPEASSQQELFGGYVAILENLGLIEKPNLQKEVDLAYVALLRSKTVTIHKEALPLLRERYTGLLSVAPSLDEYGRHTLEVTPEEI